MNRYAKFIENWKLEYAPNLVVYNGNKIISPQPEILIELGYKEVILSEMPVQTNEYYWIYKWIEKENSIIQEWEKIIIPIPEQSAQDYLWEILMGN
jgi:hypothetical protein